MSSNLRRESPFGMRFVVLPASAAYQGCRIADYAIAGCLLNAVASKKSVLRFVEEFTMDPSEIYHVLTLIKHRVRFICNVDKYNDTGIEYLPDELVYGL